ncbi:MAG: hypothetical protein KDE14_06315 [Rhodobacteraceae bacterium]|nr:hypothetical protein [Paracoccaceae bacterium]
MVKVPARTAWLSRRYVMAALPAAAALRISPGHAQASAKFFPLAAKSLVLDVASAGDHLIAVGERGFILKSADTGKSWQQVASPADVMLTSVAFIDDRRGVAVGHDTTILTTADGGETWAVAVHDPDAETPLLTVVYDTPARILAFGAYGLVMESVDGGETWTEGRLSADEPHIYGMVRAANGHMIAAGEAGALFDSADSGASWTFVDSSPYDGSYFGILALDDGGLLIYGLRGNLYRSDDNGANWSQIDIGTTATLHGAVQRADGSVVVVGLSGTVLVSQDGRAFDLVNLPDREGLTGAFETGDGTLLIYGERGARPFDPAVAIRA